jgi:hypothetical protein
MKERLKVRLQVGLLLFDLVLLVTQVALVVGGGPVNLCILLRRCSNTDSESQWQNKVT